MPVLVRSPSSSWLRRRVGGIVFALVATAGAAACGGIGITSESSGFDNGSGATGDGNDPVEGAGGISPSANFDASTGSGDAGNVGITVSADAGAEAPDTEPYTSPLCGAVTACNPDLVTGNGCGPGAADGGTSRGDASFSSPSDGSAALACRVSVSTKLSAMVAASACVAGGAGTDGYACTAGDDCSTGYECVGTPGQCRRYCCSGACSDDKTFCDVQPATAMSGITVPVCMPVANCKLLESSCPGGETCSVVADDGTTSCVATGPASEGEACDTVHCMANEICVGKSGSRVCDKLCEVGESDCSGGKVCTTNATLFAETPNVGVCAPQ